MQTGWDGPWAKLFRCLSAGLRGDGEILIASRVLGTAPPRPQQAQRDFDLDICLGAGGHSFEQRGRVANVEQRNRMQYAE